MAIITYSYEKPVKKILDKLGIKYKMHVYQQTYGVRSYYDFDCEDNNLLIEVDELHHFEPRTPRGSLLCKKILEKDQNKDILKTKWALDNGRRLLLLSYNVKDEYEQIIKESLKSNEKLILKEYGKI